jgi:N-acyl amino acid synthase of PEP-CTERM/exosortase system
MREISVLERPDRAAGLQSLDGHLGPPTPQDNHVYLPEFLNLGTGFGKYFRAEPALDDVLRRSVYRIRHQVYCEELGYEPVREDGLESDAFDERALHCLLRAKTGGEYVGCVRLVLAGDRDDDRLPFEEVCRDSIDRSIVDPAQIQRKRIAEVSRLAVISKYRRRRGEQKQPVGIEESDFGTPDRPRFPYIAAGLYLGMLALARRQGLETLFMLTEPRLARQLTRLGVRLQQVGSPIEHRGVRYPSMMSVSEVIDGLNFFVRPLFDVIAGEIDDAYARQAGNEPAVTRAS